MDTLESNKMIAEYVGYEIRYIHKKPQYEKDEMVVKKPHEHQNYYYAPHKDWNQLMEVVEKIENKTYQVDIYEKECLIGWEDETSEYHARVHVEADTKIQAVYQAVTEYIKQQKGEKNGR